MSRDSIGFQLIANPSPVIRHMQLAEPWFRLAYVTSFETGFRKPVLLNLNSSLWDALHGAGRGLPVEGQGMLLASR